MATTGKVPLLGFHAGAIRHVVLFGFSGAAANPSSNLIDVNGSYAPIVGIEGSYTPTINATGSYAPTIDVTGRAS